ncbi:GNAT family N-acetyltransferase [Shewanella sp. A32]|uniref:GNAT family N-acetyltransferase n=1 Tax=Shewanella sp. A32 TaxID=3031327 RepID=UPI0023B99F65|nr:GNAT family N-acetyltransferase [Shewanella sp. A32]MDF0533873.1 GNAT family N-acetyltransferase [Shewanella sp. A32]
MLIRAIKPGDWPLIAAVQQQCYQDLEPESLAVLQNKWQLSPESCFVMVIRERVQGYCLAHPWLDGMPPELDQILGPCDTPDTLYLHDIAVSSEARGNGFATQAFRRLVQFALQQQLGSVSLVAVQGAEDYWQMLGFSQATAKKSLSNYPENACYMRYSLSRTI